MKFSMNSSLLHCAQPDCYWEFQEYLYGIEEQEAEWRQEQAEEVIDIPEPGQPWLLGLVGKMFPGTIAKKSYRRMDLPKDHPEYQGLEECNLDWGKAKEIIAKCWLKTLEEWIKARYITDGIADGIKIEFKDTWSPRFYNYGGDECGFFLSASTEDLGHIVNKCLGEYRESFAEYLKRAHSSYDGYISFMSNNCEDYDEYWDHIKDTWEDVDEHLVWACLDFWLFGIEDMKSGNTDKLDGDGMEKRFGENQDKFRDWLWDNVTDAEGNGAFYDIMEYTPKEEEAVA